MDVVSVFIEILGNYTYLESKTDKKTDKKAEKPLKYHILRAIVFIADSVKLFRFVLERRSK